MEPKDDNQRPLSVPRRDTASNSQRPDRDLAAALMRQQIDQLYDEAPAESSTPQDSDPYSQTQPIDGDNTHEDQWKKYHTAWQQYYQQYYHRYYLAQQQNQQRTQQDQPATQSQSQLIGGKSEQITTDKAIDEIRSDLLGKVKKQTEKVRKSRHFVPIISAVFVMSLFIFMQYNRVMVAQVKAYISPGSISAENVLVDTASTVAVSDEPRIIIPKINVDAPIVYGVGSLAEGPVQEALKDGVIHYPIPGANSLPGQQGNSVFLGHSSNDVFDDGDYKFVFVQLEKLQVRDTFYINYEGTRYTYSVTSREEILPTEVNKLVTNSSKPTVTLVTCTPVGTAEKRFLIHAEQISPNPAEASEQDTSSINNQPVTITGNSPTLFERLFGS